MLRPLAAPPAVGRQCAVRALEDHDLPRRLAARCHHRAAGPCGPINGESFRAYVEQSLAPTLRPSDIVIMDNLPVTRSLVSPRLSQGRHPLLPAPYSPDFNPIEQLFAKLKAFLRKIAPRSIDALWQAIAAALEFVHPQECFRLCST
jgi:transposase